VYKRQEEAQLRNRVTPMNPGAETGNITIFRSQVLPYAPATRAFALGGPHLAAVASLIGPNVSCWFSQFVTKHPDGERGTSEFPWHQDNGYAAVSPATNLTVWTALDDVDEHNGCVWVVPGSHLQGLLPHRTPNADSWHLTLAVEGDGIPVRMRAGEAVAFSGLTLHRSKLNHSTRPRRAFFLEYADCDAMVDHPATGPVAVTERNHSWVVQGQGSLPAR
jgi:phytanoyl-CoA hydroxylase